MLLSGRVRLFLIVLVFPWLAGCAAPQTRILLAEPSLGLPRQVEWVDIPFHPQEIHQCGPASLAMVLNAAGVGIEPRDISSQVYLPGREGSLQVEMLATARRNGLFAYQLAPRLDDLLSEVAAGSPVIVLQNLALSWYPVWHYAVVVGYDLDRQEIVLRSGLEHRQVMPLSTFEHTWERAQYWSMLALPPGRMPRTASEAAYVSAAVALEKAGPAKSASAAYRAALAGWPHNLVAGIGKGNTAYALGDLKGAESAFRQVTLNHPDSAAAFNNLAQSLADQRRYDEAIEAAQKAVDLGGTDQAAILETLEEIRKLKEKAKSVR